MTGALRPRFQDGLETGKKFEEREKQSPKLCQADQRVSEKGLLQPCCDFFPCNPSATYLKGKNKGNTLKAQRNSP